MDYILVGLCSVIIILLIVLIVKGGKKETSDGVTKTDLADLERRTRDEMERSRRETSDNMTKLSENVSKLQTEMLKNQSESSERMLTNLVHQTEKMNSTLQTSVQSMQRSNEEKLEKMRETVDEKLTATLTQRLDSSFKTVGEQLESVHKSIGEMNKLTGDVSDLKRVLTNVKARGTWAEVQLGNILEQTLTFDQYETNVSIKGNSERVEFAVKIPSKEKDGAFIWLPIDSKFPQEDYIRLQEASDRADKDAVDAAAKALERRIKEEARTIKNLYIDVPKTTNFAIMFLPTEGLYAEVLRRPGLSEDIQNNYNVMIAGPTTITAFLNTLQMGFRTIAIDKKASEVWKVLGAAKTQYEKFEGLLAKAKKKITEAGDVISEAEHRNQLIQGKLRNVEVLESNEATELLELPE
ncbi:MAG: DNA recombination protein RmuC [Clostridia bacterium]|nr:DNA recombination protein RmuC [Clostridia bacterium]